MDYQFLFIRRCGKGSFLEVGGMMGRGGNMTMAGEEGEGRDYGQWEETGKMEREKYVVVGRKKEEGEG